MKKNRYFLVFFTFIKCGAMGYGHKPFTTNGCYLNRELTISDIKTTNGGCETVLTNIIELSKADYDTFCE